MLTTLTRTIAKDQGAKVNWKLMCPSQESVGFERTRVTGG
jgi:hypothetical protein